MRRSIYKSPYLEINNGIENVLHHREHSNVASFKPNLIITIAWD
jgi:hypothetical protein